MSNQNDETPPLSSAALLAELLAEVKATRQTAAQASLQAARSVQLVAAGQQLDARERQAMRDMMDSARQVFGRFERLATKILNDRPASLTVVQDTPTRAGEEDWSLVHIKLPGKSKTLPVPNRVLWGMASGVLGAVIGWIVHWLVSLK